MISIDYILYFYCNIISAFHCEQSMCYVVLSVLHTEDPREMLEDEMLLTSLGGNSQWTHTHCCESLTMSHVESCTLLIAFTCICVCAYLHVHVHVLCVHASYSMHSAHITTCTCIQHVHCCTCHAPPADIGKNMQGSEHTQGVTVHAGG